MKRVHARCAAELAVQVCDIYVVQICTAITLWRCVPTVSKLLNFPPFEMNYGNGIRFIHSIVGDDQSGLTYAVFTSIIPIRLWRMPATGLSCN